MTDTAATLARYYVTDRWCKLDQPHKCGKDCRLRPPLHTRCPETRVEGLNFYHAAWYLNERFCKPVHAADLLVQAVWSAAFIKGWGGVWGPDGTGFRVQIGPGKSAHAPALPPAVAMAMHRAKDAEGEANG